MVVSRPRRGELIKACNVWFVRQNGREALLEGIGISARFLSSHLNSTAVSPAPSDNASLKIPSTKFCNKKSNHPGTEVLVAYPPNS